MASGGKTTQDLFCEIENCILEDYSYKRRLFLQRLGEDKDNLIQKARQFLFNQQDIGVSRDERGDFDRPSVNLEYRPTEKVIQEFSVLGQLVVITCDVICSGKSLKQIVSVDYVNQLTPKSNINNPLVDHSLKEPKHLSGQSHISESEIESLHFSTMEDNFKTLSVQTLSMENKATESRGSITFEKFLEKPLKGPQSCSDYDRHSGKSNNTVFVSDGSQGTSSSSLSNVLRSVDATTIGTPEILSKCRMTFSCNLRGPGDTVVNRDIHIQQCVGAFPKYLLNDSPFFEWSIYSGWHFVSAGSHGLCTIKRRTLERIVQKPSYSGDNCLDPSKGMLYSIGGWDCTLTKYKLLVEEKKVEKLFSVEVVHGGDLKGISVSSQGKIAVTDATNACLHIFDHNGTKIHTFANIFQKWTTPTKLDWINETHICIAMHCRKGQPGYLKCIELESDNAIELWELSMGSIRNVSCINRLIYVCHMNSNKITVLNEYGEQIVEMHSQAEHACGLVQLEDTVVVLSHR